VHRIAFQLGPLTVTWYGVLVALGFYLGAWTAARRAPRAGIAPERVWELLPWTVLGGILGARLLYVATYWRRDFSGQPWWEVVAVWHGGLVFYGGFLGASLATIVWARVKRERLWAVADVMAPSLALGHALGRLGCLMNGCCYGRPCGLPWAIRFPKHHETQGLPVHPVQLYEAGLNFALFAALAWLFRRRRFDGQVFAAYLLAYAVARGAVEFFRGDYPAYTLGVLTPAHGVSSLLLAAGLALYFVLRPRKGKAPPAAA
jgi:phosphatidylglycerol:prolipoprotein diacylglycerol transferase